MTATVLNTKISEVEIKVPNDSGLVKKADYGDKISDIEGRILTTSDYDKFTSDILDAKIKQKELVNKSDISNLVTNSEFDTELRTLPTKAKLKEEQDKIVKQQTHDVSHFLGKNFFGDDGSQNMFVYRPTLDTLELKKDNGTNYVVSWKSKGLLLLSLNHYITLSCIAKNFLDIKWE